jgi:alkylhydroperoxidase/carboxymuconolactone decarboxylase family protein YurZ
VLLERIQAMRQLLERIQAMRQLLVRGMTQEEYLATVEILCPMAGNLERGEV